MARDLQIPEGVPRYERISVSMPSEMAARVKKHVKKGGASSVSELVRRALTREIGA